MTRNALLLSIAIIAGVCFACTPVAPPLAPATSFFAHGSRAQECPVNSQTPGAAFADGVQVLKTGVSDWAPGNLTPPSAGDIQGTLASLKVNAPYTIIWQQLCGAFDLAAKRFQKRLSNLSGAYIDQTSCPSGTSGCWGGNSWGFRNPADQTEYVGLSVHLWDGGTAPNFSDYEKAIFGQVLAVAASQWPSGGNGAPWPSAITGPQFGPASSNGDATVDAPVTAVLAAVAHEYGHVLWADLVKVQTGPTNSNPPTNYCANGADNFFAGSWSSANPAPYFLQFAQSTQNNPNHPSQPYDQYAYSPTIVDMEAAIQSVANQEFGLAQYNTAVGLVAQDLDALLQSAYDSNGNQKSKVGVWASVFGAVSPEEDFVESFKFAILTLNSSVAIDSMPIQFTDTANNIPYSENIFADFAKQPGSGHHARKDTLVKKVKNCIHADTHW
jgi:hypothetical protein